MARRIVETKGMSIDRELLLRIVVYEEGVCKTIVRNDNPYTKRHHVLFQAGNGYEFK